MEKKLVRSGNSQAVVLDRFMLRQLEIDDRVEIMLLKGRIVITKPAKKIPDINPIIQRLKIDPKAQACSQPTRKQSPRRNDDRAGKQGDHSP